MEKLYDKLVAYSREDYYPMHMPGHKRNKAMVSMINPYEIDITEIDGFDNLHQADGLLKELSNRVSNLYGSVKSYLLVNGSTAGILAGICAATKPQDKVIVARNCHKSVYHGIVLRNLEPLYIYPQTIPGIPIYGGILPEKLDEMLIKHPDTKLIIITSPTYEGIVSDIEELAAVAHGHGALLMVDEAHGAHFGFHKGFPESAISKGADIVIQSVHKTLPAFTQTAILHLNQENISRSIEKYLSIYQSSSPSYILMAGIDRCISLLEQDSPKLFEDYINKLEKFYKAMDKLKNMQIIDKSYLVQQGIFNNKGQGYGIYDVDPSKITISVRNTSINGHSLGQLLREKYKIAMEMEALDYILGMTSICDTQRGFEGLAKALLEIDKDIKPYYGEDNIKTKTYDLEDLQIVNRDKEQVFTPSDAMEQPVEIVPLRESLNRISASFISLFPPGSPVLVPGEKINETIILFIKEALSSGLAVNGLIGEEKMQVEVIKGS
mgnify:FL=1